MTAESQLSLNFDALGLPAPAKAWLLDLWAVIQVLDDALDGDKADPGQVNQAAWAIFVNMPLNDFYRQSMATLQPILALQLMKWQAANIVEELGLADERSYMFRAGYYEVVLMVCHLCGIEGAGRACMELYGESFAEYMEGR